MDKQQIYEQKYVGPVIRAGRSINAIGLVLMYLPCFLLIATGHAPIWSAVATALVIRLSSCAMAYVIEPMSFYPGLGLAGSYIANLVGFGSTLCLPCGICAEEAAGAQPGSPESECVKAVGVAIGSLVKCAILIVTVVFCSSLLNVMPASVTSTLGYLIPALFGSLIAGYVVKNWKLGFISLAISIPLTLLVFMGYVSFQ